jgi:hypothetical protein
MFAEKCVQHWQTAIETDECVQLRYLFILVKKKLADIDYGAGVILKPVCHQRLLGI